MSSTFVTQETARGPEDGAVGQFTQLGRFLLAATMIMYGIDHFLFAPFVATIVPPWIPWHLFWVYFCGVALIAAGVSVVVKRRAYLAATLLGAMILLFVLLIHTRLIANRPGDAFAARSMFGDFPGRLINCFKDFGLCGAAFIFAGTQSKAWRISGRNKLLELGRVIFAISITAFGVLHFVYPVFAPGIPPMVENVSFWIPGHLFWVYLTGAALLVFGVSLLVKKKTGQVATWLGAFILLFLLLTWVPELAAHPGEIVAGNWLKDLGLAGGALILAGAYRNSTEW